MGFKEWFEKQLFGRVNDQITQSFIQGILQRSEPPKRGTAELINAYNTMPWLRAVSSKISMSVATIPWTLHVQERNGRAIRNRKIQQSDGLMRKKLIKQEGGDIREIENHPLLDLLDNPNDQITGRAARQVIQIYLDLKGETFLLIERNNAGMPIEFFPIPPHWIIDIPKTGFPFFRISFESVQMDVPETEIIWIKDPNPLNPYRRGSGVAESLGDELETDEFASKHVKSWFFNRAVPDILVGVEGAGEDQLKAAKQRWEDQHRGFMRSFRSHWHSGNINVEQLSQTFAEQQFIELREFERNTIMQVFGIPPEVMGVIDSSNRATIEAADFLFTRWVLTPRLELLRSELQEKLIPQFDDRLILDFESPVVEDKEHILKVAQSAPWSLSIDEWRDMQGLPSDERRGGLALVPLNLIAERTGFATPTTEDLETEERNQKKKIIKIRNDDIPTIVDQLAPELLTSELNPIFQTMVEEWGNKVLKDIGIDVSFNILNPLVANHLQEASTVRVRDLVNNTTRQELRSTLIEGVRAGEGIPQLASRVSQTFDLAKGSRSVRIARTEVLRSTNFANLSAFRQSGVVEQKEWATAIDGRERESHNQLDGQIRAITDPFTTFEGNTAMHPGGFGIASEDVNCRCVVIPVISDPTRAKLYKQRREQIRAREERDRIAFERKMERGLKRGFQQQQNAVMELLNGMR